MIAASAGVVLPPKEKSALSPVTACKVGAWFGNGPSHSTLMPSFASTFSNSPRSLAIRLRPVSPQVRRTRSVVLPVVDRARSLMPRPARAPTPAAAVPRKRRRDGLPNEERDMSMILPETLCGMRGEHAEFGEKRASFDQGGVIRFAMFKGYGAAAHHQDSIGQRDSLVDVVRDEQDAGLMAGDEFANEIVHTDTRERVERGERLVQQQKLRLLHQRAGEGHALRLST